MPRIQYKKRSNDIWKEIQSGNLSVLDRDVLTDDALENIAADIRRTESFGLTLRLLENLPRHGRAYDWNVGAILQRFDSDLVSSVLELQSGSATSDSLGIAWLRLIVAVEKALAEKNAMLSKTIAGELRSLTARISPSTKSRD